MNTSNPLATARQALEAAELEHAQRTEAVEAAAAQLHQTHPDQADDYDAAARAHGRAVAAAARALEDVERARETLATAEQDQRRAELARAIAAADREQLFAQLEEPIGALAQAELVLQCDHYSAEVDPAELGAAFARGLASRRTIRAAVQAQHAAVGRARELAAELGEGVRALPVPEDHLLSLVAVEGLAAAPELDVEALLRVRLSGDSSTPTRGHVHKGRLPFADAAYLAIARDACRRGSWDRAIAAWHADHPSAAEIADREFVARARANGDPIASHALARQPSGVSRYLENQRPGAAV